MKKLFAMALAAVMMLSLAACGAKKEEAPAAPSAPAASAPAATPADPSKPLAMGDTANPAKLSIVIKDRSPENADDAAWIATLNEKLLERSALRADLHAAEIGIGVDGSTRLGDEDLLGLILTGFIPVGDEVVLSTLCSPAESGDSEICVSCLNSSHYCVE